MKKDNELRNHFILAITVISVAIVLSFVFMTTRLEKSLTTVGQALYDPYEEERVSNWEWPWEEPQDQGVATAQPQPPPKKKNIPNPNPVIALDPSAQCSSTKELTARVTLEINVIGLPIEIVEDMCANTQQLLEADSQRECSAHCNYCTGSVNALGLPTLEVISIIYEPEASSSFTCSLSGTCSCIPPE